MTGPRAALGLLVMHVFLVASLGAAYAKLQLSLGGLQIYPTEVVVGAIAVLGSRAILAVPRDAITKLVLGFLAFGAIWVGVAGVGESGGAGEKAFSFFVYSAIYFVVRGAARSDDDRWKFLRVISAAAVIGAGIGLWQMTSGTRLLGGGDEFEITTTGSTRWLGGDFALYAMFASLTITFEAIVRRRFTHGMALVLAAGLTEMLLSQHRSIFVSYALAVGVTFVVLGGSAIALSRMAKLFAAIALGIVVVGYVFGGSYFAETATRLGHVADMSDTNISWRWLSWYEVFDGVTDAPLGHGFAVWDFMFNATDPLTGSHNSLLDLAYRIGVPGLAVFLATPWALFRQTRRRVRARGAQNELLLVTSCAALLGFLVFACFNVVLETPYMSIFFWLYLGIAAGAHDERSIA